MERMDIKEVAKLVRKDLKTQFPGVKFSVKSQRYSGGSTINVYWDMGPSKDSVRGAVGHYHGFDFDTIDDSTKSNGRPYANHSIYFSRTIKKETYLSEALKIAKAHNVEIPENPTYSNLEFINLGGDGWNDIGVNTLKKIAATSY